MFRIEPDRSAGQWCQEPFKRHGIQDVPAEKRSLPRLPALFNSRRAELLDARRLVHLVGRECHISRGEGDFDRPRPGRPPRYRQCLRRGCSWPPPNA